MSHTSGTNLTGRRWLLPCLLGGLVLSNTAGAQAQAPSTASHGHGPAVAGSYRVINLGVGELASTPQINDSDQVAYTLNTGQVLFYNGTNIVSISPQAGTLGGSIGLNNAGQVAGSYLRPDGFNGQGYVWSQAAGMNLLPTLGGNSVFAYLINNRGQVAGNSTAPDSSTHAFLWSLASGIEDIGLFPGAALPGFTNATGLNDKGMVVGWGSDENRNGHAFAWTRKTGVVDLGTLGGSFSIAQGVNAAGQVIGSATIAGDLYWHAFVWTPGGGMQDLGTGGGVDSGAGAINDKGQVVGSIGLSPSQRHGFSWTRAGGLIDLGTLGGPNSDVVDLNDKGLVVGTSTTKQGVYHAIVWSAKEGLVDLNKRLRHAPPGLVVDVATTISNNGAIVATSNAGLVLLKPDCGCTGMHTVGPIAAPDMVEVGAPVEGSVGFAGADTAARHHVTWSWGDGSGDQAGHVRESGGSGSAAGSHAYAAPGIYTVSATVTDLGGKHATAARRIVVHEKAGGVVRGSGWFVSPQGANRQARTASGKATFHLVAASPFVSKTSASRAELQFRSGTLNFRSQTLKPVALQGARAQFAGSGTVNGSGDYRFTLATTEDGTNSPARFGLKIWHLDPVTRAEVVDYDNLSADGGGSGSAVQGSIVHQL